MNKDVTIVAAMSELGVIGVDGALPWHCPADLKRFKQLTLGGVAVMGRKTWESLPDNARPLPGRTNVVLSRNASYVARGASVYGSLRDVQADPMFEGRSLYAIGGAEVFASAMVVAHTVELTAVEGFYDGANVAYMPPIPPWFVESPPGGVAAEGCVFFTYRRLTA